MRKSILILPLIAVMSACTPPMTREEQLSIYRNRCLDYGYQYGTVEFADCMKEQEARDEELAVQQCIADAEKRKAKALEDKNRIYRDQLYETKKDHKRKKKSKYKDSSFEYSETLELDSYDF